MNKPIGLLLGVSLVFNVLTISCTKNETYYKKAIEEWLDQNLHDNTSYESVEYKIVDSERKLKKYIPSIAYQYSNFENVLQRKMDLLISIVDILKNKVEKEKISELVELRGRVISILSQGIVEIDRILSINDSLDFQINKQMNHLTLSQNGKKLRTQYEGTNNRIQIEKERLLNEIDKLNPSFTNIENKLDKGLLIYHQFRAYNMVGAKVLHYIIFELNNQKTEVINTYNIDK